MDTLFAIALLLAASFVEIGCALILAIPSVVFVVLWKREREKRIVVEVRLSECHAQRAMDARCRRVLTDATMTVQ